MEVLHFPDDPRPPWLVHPVLALGNFDGLHRGHLKIVERVKRGAVEHGGIAMAMTFDPHPPQVVRPDKAPPLLMTKDQRIAALDKAGIHCVAVVRFTRELSQWDPGDLRAHGAWSNGCAYRRYGSAPTSSSATSAAAISACCARSGSATASARKRSTRSATRNSSSAAPASVVSSPKDAWTKPAALLGHPFTLAGRVVEGRHRGRELGFPTANLMTANELIPPHGVYATTLTIDGIVRAAITNIGVNPTFGDDGAATIETYVLEYDGDLYGQRCATRLRAAPA